MVGAYNSEDKYIHKYSEILAQTHDSCLIQIHDVRKSWERTAYILRKLKSMMEPTLNYSRQDFVIPTDLKIGINWGRNDRSRNPGGMMEISFSNSNRELAATLENAYGRLTR